MWSRLNAAITALHPLPLCQDGEAWSQPAPSGAHRAVRGAPLHPPPPVSGWRGVEPACPLRRPPSIPLALCQDGEAWSQPAPSDAHRAVRGAPLHPPPPEPACPLRRPVPPTLHPPPPVSGWRGVEPACSLRRPPRCSRCPARRPRRPPCTGRAWRRAAPCSAVSTSTAVTSRRRSASLSSLTRPPPTSVSARRVDAPHAGYSCDWGIYQLFLRYGSF